MIYVQSDPILNNFVIKNFQAMAKVGSTKNLTIVVQWNKPGKQGTWRYVIEKNIMKRIDPERRYPRAHDFTHDLINFADFVVTRYPADNYAFIFSCHGVGIIDPSWSQLQQFAVNPATLRNQSQLEQSRGILFDISNRRYLNNQGLTQAFDHITKNIIQKKFALIGMDACLMSMLEVHYQIRNFADYLVASEEVELAHGWNYEPFLSALAHNTITPAELAQRIVVTFEQLYKGQTKFYTQTAIHLGEISYIKDNLDLILYNLELCRDIDTTTLQQAVLNARRQCLQLSIPFYIDLHSFYTELHTQLVALEQPTEDADRKALIESQAFSALKEQLLLGTNLINTVVIAKVTSTYLARAQGISIYFPQKTIDPSYLKTAFAQDSLWLPFLQNTIE